MDLKAKESAKKRRDGKRGPPRKTRGGKGEKGKKNIT